MDWLLLIILGLGGGIGQLCVTQAYRHASAATVAPMIYSALLWAMFYGYMFWGEIPDSTLITGAIFIVASGLYIIYRETRRHVPVTASTPQAVDEKS